MTINREQTFIEKHINPEISIFQDCYSVLKLGGLTKSHERVFLESFLLHSRNFYYFFVGPKKHIDDVFASDFLNPGLVNIDMGGFPIKRINKQLTHLSYDRLKTIELIEFSDKEKIEGIYEFIKKGLGEFNAKSTKYKLLELK